MKSSFKLMSTQVVKSFHKRILPDSLTSLSSPAGKLLFREALALGGMESFFPLSEQFITQSEPSYCSLSSLAMVLNALNFDPKKIWKGAWRWVSEETLQCESQAICGHSLERIKSDGMNFNEFESLARCHGVNIRSHRVRNHYTDGQKTTEFDAFRQCVDSVSASDDSNTFIVVNFSRQSLGQSGIGHFSPIGGYHSEKQLVLIMDVARFKYPPYWVPLEELWRSMMLEDDRTGEARGYFIISGSGPSEKTDSGEACRSKAASMLSTHDQHIHGDPLQVCCAHAHTAPPANV